MAETSIFKNQNQLFNISHSTPPPLSMRRDSQLISKPKPKIRIIHIFAPEIIKTDVENFRELVQRLTGKPAHDLQQKKNSSNKMKKQRAPRKDQENPRKNTNNFTSVHQNQLQEEKKMARSVCSSGFHGVRVEEEKAPRKDQENPRKNNNNFTSVHENQLQEEKKMARSGCSSGFHGVKEEEGEGEEGRGGVMWSNNGGYLNGLSDFEGFMHEFGEFPLMPLHVFEETQFA